ncbi:MAG: hypothetical protein AAFO69_18810, partial [Bacteroidota bacterium]
MIRGKRFLWLTENYPPQRGGMSRSCDRIVHSFRAAGAVVDVFHFFSGKQRSATITESGNYVPLEVTESESHTINLAWTQIDCDRPRYDYLVSFGSHLSMIAAPIFAKWLQISLVSMIRGNDFDSSIFSPRKRSLITDLIESSEVVFTVSSEKKQKIQSLWPDKTVEFVANGIELSEWQGS